MTSQPTLLQRMRGRVRAAHRTGDEGFTMILVIGIAFTMTALLTTSLAYAIRTNQGTAAESTNYTLSYNAALAGLNDFTARMNSYQSPNGGSYCSQGDATNGAYSGWQELPGDQTAGYHYEVTSDCTLATGNTQVVSLKVSGIAGPRLGPVPPSVRTLTATLTRPGFGDYVFFTDKEEPDPGLAEYALSPADQTYCANTYNFTATARDTRDTKCGRLGWGDGDVLNGKVHTNDIIKVNGDAQFNDVYSEGCVGIAATAACKTTKWINDGSNSPTFSKGIKTDTVLAFPETDETVSAAASANGCTYYGPTRIVLLNTGKMSISSPRSTSTAACPTGASVSFPANKVVYVQDAPSAACGTAPWVTSLTAASYANVGMSFPLADDYDTQYMTCNDGNLWIEGVLDGQVVIGAKQDIYITGPLTYKDGLTGAGADDVLGLVAQNSIAFYHPIGDVTTLTAAGYCKRVLVKSASSVKTGETTDTHCENTKMKFTASSASSITDATAATCTGSLVTNTGSNSYCNYGTWTDATYSTVTKELCADPCGENLVVNASMLALTHSIRVPYFNHVKTRDLGTLTINGSLAQKFRGPVRTGSSGSYRGYTKTYNYDPRLKNIKLLGFPAPGAEYAGTLYTELKPQVNSGCYKIGTENWRTYNVAGTVCT